MTHATATLRLAAELFHAPGSPPPQCTTPKLAGTLATWSPTAEAPALAVSRRCGFHGEPAPEHRTPAGVAWDPAGRQLIVVAGKSVFKPDPKVPKAVLKDTWAFRFGEVPSWTLLASGHEGDGLLPRHGSVVLVDPVAHRLVLYGGRHSGKWSIHPDYDPSLHLPDPESPLYSDTLVLGLDPPHAWTELAIPQPDPVRWAAGSIYDPVGHRLVMHGGQEIYGEDIGQETWALDLALGEEEWSLLETATKPTGVQERRASAAFYDATRHRFLLVGGFAAYPQHEAYPDAWALPLDHPEQGWTPLPFTNPDQGPGAAFHAWQGFHEPKADRYYLKGGLAYDTMELFHDFAWNHHATHDVWALVPNADDTLTWYRLRTAAPGGGWPTGSPVFWDLDRNLGITSFGAVSGNYGGGVGSPQWMVNEVRVLTIFDPIAPP